MLVIKHYSKEHLRTMLVIGGCSEYGKLSELGSLFRPPQKDGTLIKKGPKRDLNNSDRELPIL